MRGKLGLPVERDLSLTAKHPLSVYAEAAHQVERSPKTAARSCGPPPLLRQRGGMNRHIETFHVASSGISIEIRYETSSARGTTRGVLTDSMFPVTGEQAKALQKSECSSSPARAWRAPCRWVAGCRKS